jgi:hypothetical protein
VSELGEDKLFGQVNPRKARGRFLEFCRCLRSPCPPQIRIAIVCDNFSPHLTMAKDGQVGAWGAASTIDLAYTLDNASWLNRIPVNPNTVYLGTSQCSHTLPELRFYQTILA